MLSAIIQVGTSMVSHGVLGIMMIIQVLTDALVFTTLFEEVCQLFNISVPVLGNNGSANSTNVTVATSPQPSMDSSTGAAERVSTRRHISWTMSGAVCIAVLVVGL